MIVGIGELLWDIFPDGRKVAGGAPFNFAFHCRQLGHAAAIISRIGDDTLGRELRAAVQQHGLSDEFLQVDTHHPTGTVTVTVDAAGQPGYTITEDVAWDHLAWEPRLAAAVPRLAVICLGTLAQRAPTTRATIGKLLETSADALKVFDVNLRQPLDAALTRLVHQQIRQCDWLKLNADEINNLLNGPEWETQICEPIDRKQSPIRCLFDPGLNPKRVGIFTRGEKGVAVTDWQRTEWVPGLTVDVVDTVGAGDAFTAAMVCLYREGRPLRECARFANYYAARVCEHQGATPVIDRRTVEAIAFRG